MSFDPSEMPSATFARRVKEIRENRRPRLSQEALAQRIMRLQGRDDPSKLESARVMVSRTESGRRVATIDDLFWFSRALEVAPFELLSGTGASVMQQTADLLEQATRVGRMVADVNRQLEATKANLPAGPERDELEQLLSEGRQLVGAEESEAGKPGLEEMRNSLLRAPQEEEEEQLRELQRERESSTQVEKEESDRGEHR
jgi:hypothetical protein